MMYPVPYIQGADVLPSVAVGLWFVVIAYEFLLFGYFLLLKGFRLWAWGQRQKGNTLFFVFFALFFLFLAISRGFFIVWDFYVTNTVTFLWLWRIGEVMQWIALTFIMLAVTMRIFGNRFLKFGIPIIPAICALFFIVLPDDIMILGSAGTVIFVLNDIIAPIYAIVIPLIYLYVAIQSAGVIRNSSLLVAGGFLIYYLGQALQTLFIYGIPNSVGMILAPSVVIIGLLVMTAGAILMK
jgi:hypothetical protein